MIFEIGKTYQHNTGKKMTIIGRVKSPIYGECLIGECDTGELVPVGGTEANTVNWYEVEFPLEIIDKHKTENENDYISRSKIIELIKINRNVEYEKSIKAEVQHKSVIRSKHDAHVAFCDYLINEINKL